jgi:hypothetical protein
VKRSLLILQFGDQFFGPINRGLIAYLALYPPISFDRFVYLNALLTHKKFHVAWVLITTDAQADDLFHLTEDLIKFTQAGAELFA